MHAIEFITELQAEPVLIVPPEIAAQLPKTERARVIVLTTEEDLEDDAWRRGAYAQFVRDDVPEDAVYDDYP
jgi:hypothetical protein